MDDTGTGATSPTENQAGEMNGKPEQSKDAEQHAMLEERLQGLIEAAQGQREQLQADAERRIAEAQEVLTEARAESERERGHRAKLERELAAEKEARAIAEHKLASAGSEKTKLREHLETNEKQLDQAKAGLEVASETRKALDTMQHKLEAARAEIHRKGDEVADAERRVSQAHGQIESELRARGEVERALEQVRVEAERRASELRTELHEESQLRAEAERSATEARSVAQEATDTADAAKARIGELEERLGKLDARAQRDRTNLERRLVAQRENFAEMEKQVHASAAAEQASRAEVEQLRAQLEQRTGELSAAGQRITVLQDALAEARERAAIEQEERRATIAAQEAARGELESRLKAAASWEREARRTISDAGAELQQRAEELAKAEQKVTELEVAIADARNAATEERQRRRADAERFASERAAAQQRVEQLEEAGNTAREATEKVNAELESRAKSIAELERRLQDAVSAAQAERSQTVALKQQLESAQAAAKAQEAELLVVERRIDAALDRRIAATIDAERNTRKLTEEHMNAVKRRQAELAAIEQRISEARAILTELHQTSDQEAQHRTELQQRLQALAEQREREARENGQPEVVAAGPAEQPHTNGDTGGARKRFGKR